MDRKSFTPALTDAGDLPLDVLLEHLRRWRSDTAATIDRLCAHRERAAEVARQLESPQAVVEYLDFFVDWFRRAGEEIARILEQLARGVDGRAADALAQIASNAALDERRCLIFRDTWINRPLPYEQVRPLLHAISSDTRDQLVDYRDLRLVAARLRALAETAPADSQALGRRELLTRLLGRDAEPRRGSD
jgi:hypothetical protein